MEAKQAHNSKRDRYKPWFDFTVLILAHLLLLPIWVLLWTVIPLLIWLSDRGPVFYKQQRAGKNKRVFTLIKFRTMVLDADLKGPAWTVAGDPRITPVGRLLRRTALDELPEVLNIWKREMSLVGPRALDVEEQRSLEESIPGFENRLQAAPGLTGLAQIYDRSDDANDKFRHDLSYLDRMSPWLDFKLLVLSVWNTFTARWDQRQGKPFNVHTSPDEPGDDHRCQADSKGGLAAMDTGQERSKTPGSSDKPNRGSRPAGG